MFKRIVAILVCLLFVSVTGCGGKTSTSTSSSEEPTKVITLAEAKGYIQKGEVLGADIKLDTSIDAVTSFFTPTTAATVATKAGETTTIPDEIDNDNEKYLVVSGDDIINMSVGQTNYYYKKADKSKGISVIVSFTKAFKFVPLVDTGDNIINNLGKPDKTDTPLSKDLFFLPDNPDNIKRLTYVVEKNELDFILADNILIATVLTDTGVWSKK